MKSILDPTFRYVPSAQTDIRKTFNRIRRELARKTAPMDSRAAPRTSARIVELNALPRYSVR